MTAFAVPVSGLSAQFILQEMLTRIGRNSFLVFSLLLPIMAGMGINFGMVLGAMAGEIGLIFAVDWDILGVNGLVFASLVGMPIAIFLGWIAGEVLNRARGREMVTGYILGFFMDGVYQLVVLYLMGSIIPMRSPAITLSRGYGIRNTLDLDSVRQTLDNLLTVTVRSLRPPRGHLPGHSRAVPLHHLVPQDQAGPGHAGDRAGPAGVPLRGHLRWSGPASSPSSSPRCWP